MSANWAACWRGACAITRPIIVVQRPGAGFSRAYPRVLMCVFALWHAVGWWMGLEQQLAEQTAACSSSWGRAVGLQGNLLDRDCVGCSGDVGGTHTHTCPRCKHILHWLQYTQKPDTQFVSRHVETVRSDSAQLHRAIQCNSGHVM